ncbi:hypothetical protein CN070_30840 [Sinorhizobium meliloti]|nr:hypothetical protein CN070_30840 [Sinorhizobium meliloti]
MAKGNCPVTIGEDAILRRAEEFDAGNHLQWRKDLADDTEPSGPGAPFARITAISIGPSENSPRAALRVRSRR